jgi:type III pantothenate kinase
MLLAIDVGNTNTVLGIYDGKELLHDWRVRTVIDHTVDEYGALILNLLKNSRFSEQSIKHIIISCVVPPMLNILEPLCRKYFGIEPLIVGPGVKTGMPIFYDNPREVGADRIVNAVAAYEKYRREMIIVDFGTADLRLYLAEGGIHGRLHRPGDHDLQRGALR